MDPRSRALVALTLCLLACVSASPAALAASGDGGIAFRRCNPTPLPAVADDFFDADNRSRCGRLTVPLDRSGVVRGRLGLHVVMLPPRRGPARQTIVSISGGPGQAATDGFSADARALGPALRHRRLVAFDQRGTGRSGELSCPSLRRAGRSRATFGRAIAACARRLGPARRSYATADSVADLEALRRALGAPRLILHGTSYGTKVALNYAARHPARVEALVLDSVVPPEGVDPFARSSFAAMPRVLAAICADGCPFTPDPGADLAALVQRIREQGPLRGRWFDRLGRPRTLALTRERVLDLLIDGDLDPLLRIALPAALRSAVRGDAAPLARLAAPRRFAEDGLREPALFVATRCADGPAPWPAGTPVAQRAAAVAAALAALPVGALAPFDAATLQADGALELCRTWPETPAAGPQRPLPDVPALLLSGDEDLRTPREDALAVAAQLPRATLVRLPRTGHSALGTGGCATVALRSFLAGRGAAACPTGTPALPAAPLVPALLAEVVPAPGLPAPVGRTLTAVQATYADLEQQMLRTVLGFMDSDWDIDDAEQPRLGWGGLRGGHAVEHGLGYRVRDYEVVAGVRVSGGAPMMDDGAGGSTYTLRVRGAEAAHGRVRIGPRRIAGRLGGVRIDVPNPVPPLFGDLPAARPNDRD